MHPARGLNVDPAHEYGSEWGTNSLDSDLESSSDDDSVILPGEFERYLEPINGRLPLPDWRPIFANLTSLTLVLTLGCCRPSHDESIISDREEVRKLGSRKIKEALDFYDIHVPRSVAFHRRVRCESHQCFCSVKNKKCNRLQRYIKELWVGDSGSSKRNEV